MQAVLLATGETEKLAPLCESIPSPMIPVVNQPVMTKPIELLARYGIKDIVVSLHHLGGSIESYFGVGRRWGVQIDYVLQRDPLGNAGALRWAKSKLQDKFVVLPGDAIIDVDLDAAIAFHNQHQNPITMIVHEEPQKGKQFFVDKTSHPAILSAAATESTIYATGAYIMDASVIDHIPSRNRYDIDRDLIPGLIAHGQEISIFKMAGYWNPIVDFKQYQDAQNDYLKSASGLSNGNGQIRYPSIESNQIGTQVWAGKNNAIHPSVRIIPPVCIGDNCQIGRDVELGPYTIVGSNVIIDDEASIANSTIIDHTYVGQLVNVSNRFVVKSLMVDAESSQSTEIVDRFLIGEATPSLVNTSFRRIIDILLVLDILILTSPLWLFVSIITLLTTGRIFVREQFLGTTPRALASGQNVGPHRMGLYRFATSRGTSETGFGRWLKKWEGHRIPELINILTGELGLVGVKPLTAEETKLVTEEWQRKRYDYFCGFTGPWYTRCSATSSFEEQLIADVYYVATRDWREDLTIILNTPRRWRQ